MKDAYKELLEAAKAAGYVAGEIHEITSDGLGFEDLKSVKDLIDNKRILSEGFEGISEASLKGLSYDQLIQFGLAFKQGFDLGKA